MARPKGKTVVKTPAEKAAAAKEKAARFSKLASKRVTKALKYISLIGNLSGSGYTYTAEQVTKIETLLTDSVEAVMARFVPGTKAAEAEAIVI